MGKIKREHGKSCGDRLIGDKQVHGRGERVLFQEADWRWRPVKNFKLDTGVTEKFHEGIIIVSAEGDEPGNPGVNQHLGAEYAG